MKKNLTVLLSTLVLFSAKAQTFVADFELFNLSPNSAYTSTASTPFQTFNATFPYIWDPSFGGFWSGGSAYTNKYDSIGGTFGNLYGVRAYKGYTNSATYVVGQDRAIVRLNAPYKTVDGFYVTNTTYAYKSLLLGNQFSRKFGDTTGTGSGTTIPQGSYPDYFKLTVKGFKNGSMKTDSVEFFLADYRFANNTQDYAVNDWRWCNTSSLGDVDSIKFFMYSTDRGSFGINTPLFFAMDNFTSSTPNLVGLNEGAANKEPFVFPNPVQDQFTLVCDVDQSISWSLCDGTGRVWQEGNCDKGQQHVNMAEYPAGLYVLRIQDANGTRVKKISKQ